MASMVDDFCPSCGREFDSSNFTVNHARVTGRYVVAEIASSDGGVQIDALFRIVSDDAVRMVDVQSVRGIAPEAVSQFAQTFEVLVGSKMSRR